MTVRFYPEQGGEPTPGEWIHANHGGEACASMLGDRGQRVGPWFRVSELQGRFWRSPPSDRSGCGWEGVYTPVELEPAHATEKPSNPKDEAATDRAPLALVPVAAIVEESLAWFEGLLKYGAHNYTIVGVRSSVYVFAALRHIFKWWLGQERDPKTGVHHLGYARACLGVLLDNQLRGKLEDDRPPSVPSEAVDGLFDSASATMRSLFAQFGSRKPRHYTIADTEK